MGTDAERTADHATATSTREPRAIPARRSPASRRQPDARAGARADRRRARASSRRGRARARRRPSRRPQPRRPQTGTLDKDELRRAVARRRDADDEDDGRLSADDVIAPDRRSAAIPSRPRSIEPASRAPHEGLRLRQPEGRRRQDDDHPQPRGGALGVGPPRPLRRPRPAGKPDDEPGHRPRHGRAEPLPRARREGPDPGHRHPARDRPRRRPRSTSPAPRSR